MYVVKGAEMTFVRKIRTFNVDEIDTSIPSQRAPKLHTVYMLWLAYLYIGNSEFELEKKTIKHL